MVKYPMDVFGYLTFKLEIVCNFKKAPTMDTIFFK
jgi:hypothetical protein